MLAGFITSGFVTDSDCEGTLCSTCGCCQHCDPINCGCEMGTVTTSFELTCPGYGCDCAGGG